MRDNEHSIGRWISILYRYGQGHIGKKLEKYNIGSGQYIFLLALYRKDGISQEEISAHLKIDKATTAKAIKRLEEEGYILRETDIDDKRAYKVYLTEKALDIKPFVQAVIADWNNILASGLSEDEKENVLRLLKKMAENAFEHIEKDMEKR